MTIDEYTLQRCRTANLVRLARALRVRVPTARHSDHVRRALLIRDIAAAIRATASAAAGAASVVVAAIALGVL